MAGSRRIYDETAEELCFNSNPTSILRRTSYLTARCCGLPMKRMRVRMAKFRGGGKREINSLEYGECPCCGNQIIVAETNPLKAFFSWLREKFMKK